MSHDQEKVENSCFEVRYLISNIREISTNTRRLALAMLIFSLDRKYLWNYKILTRKSVKYYNKAAQLAVNHLPKAQVEFKPSHIIILVSETFSYFKGNSNQFWYQNFDVNMQIYVFRAMKFSQKRG